MAGTSLFALIDDITTILDDVATMTKVATKKTAGVLGDDLALNAEQVFGFKAERELPVVWAVAKGSALNKLILIPSALLVAHFLPWLIHPALMVGGAFLCFEGFEKILHSAKKKKHSPQEAAETLEKVGDHYEKDKIKGAVRTDFILSAEIVVITLGTVTEAPFLKQLTVLALISAIMTVGVYGLVAIIVKMDDFGLFLAKKPSEFFKYVGNALVQGAPWLLKILSVVGTVAMFLVGGNLVAHGFHSIVELFAKWNNGLYTMLAEILVGLLVGAFVYFGYALLKHIRPSKKSST